MKISSRKGWWVILPLAVIGVFAPMLAKASEQVDPGLNVTVYNNYWYNNAPPLPTTSGRPVVGTTTQTDINHNFDTEPLFNMYEDFIVKYEGYITSPVNAQIIFYPYADDGTKLYLDGVLIDNNWFDKGGGGNPTAPQSFIADVPRQITYWYYENGGGAWTTLYWNIGNGIQVVPESAFTKTAVIMSTTTTSTTTTTTVAPYFNSVENLTAVANEDGSVLLDWDQPAASNTNPYMYNILFFDLVNEVETGGWGVWTYAANTSYSLGHWMWAGTTGYGPIRFKIQAGTAPCVGEGDGSCLYGPQSSVDITVVEPAAPTTTTSTTTTTTTVPETTSTTTSTTSTTTIPPTTSSTSTTTTTTLPPETTTTTVYVPTATTTTTTEPPVTTTTEPEDETTTTTEPEETTTTEPEEETTTTTEPEITTSTEPEEESTTTTEPITETTEPEPVVDTTILENEEDLVEEEENTPPVTIPEDIQSSQEAVEAILKIDVAEAPVEELKEVFKAIEPDELTDEQKEAIIEVIQNAPEEVKEAFEEEVDIYSGGFDNYVPVGSAIDVGTRKTVIAAIATLTATTTLAAVPPSSGGSPTGGSSSGGGSSGGGGSTGEARSRKEEESGDEPAGEIAGPEDGDDTDYAHNSIFKYYIKEGIKMKKFDWFGFSKKLWDITAGLAFTLAGSFVVYITLSGTTQRLAGISTLIALFVHYLHEILKNDIE